MANIKISWTNPADVSDQDSVKIFRATGDQTALADAAFRTAAGTEIFTDTSVATGADEYIDLNVPASTTYTYGAFSYNAAGFGPGDVANSVITLA
jgi:hypothetical protein